MNKKNKRAYDKVMNNYEKGKINKALDICEEILSEGLDNPAVLNFKGLLLYQKGNLNEAMTVWRINSDLNDDNIAKNYINDSKADEKRLELYKQGEQALRQLKIDKAMELFMKCAESDFNSIKVNTGIALCYQKKGDFYKAKEYVDKVLKIDQNAVTARIIEKELKENGICFESKNSSRAFLTGITILFIILAIVVGRYIVLSRSYNKDLDSNIEEVNNNESSEKSNFSNDENTESNIKENSESGSGPIEDKPNNIKFDRQNVKTLMANNDLDGVYEQIKNVDEKSLNSGDMDVYIQAVEMMKNQGISKFYDSGLLNFNQHNYSEAKSFFDKAYAYSEGSSIKEHILFYRASTSSKMPDKTVAIAQFEEYYKQYSKGVYVEETLYELALLTNSIDKEKSKTYAKTLIQNFPNSIYINDRIVGISRS